MCCEPGLKKKTAIIKKAEEGAEDMFELLRYSKRNYLETILIAIGVSFASTVSGLTFSYYQDLKPGATIVLFSVFLLVLFLAIGTLAKFFRRRKKC